MGKSIFLRDKNIKVLHLWQDTPWYYSLVPIKKQKQNQEERHYTDFFLFRNLGPLTALGMAQAGVWTVGGGIHTWAMEGFLGTGHFLGLAQEWHSRQLQHKDINFFNPMYSHDWPWKWLNFTSLNPCMLFTVSCRFFTYLFPWTPSLVILEKTTYSSSIWLLRSIILKFKTSQDFKQRHD